LNEQGSVRWIRGLVVAALALGIGFRIWQWLAGTSMWQDELWIALNVRDRSMGALLSTPLDYRQMAPAGFLAWVKASTQLFGVGDRALRLVPFLAGVLALLLLWRVARRFVSRIGLVGVLMVSATSPALIWYAGNVKQYAVDVAAALLLVWLALRHVEEPADVRRAAWAAGLGALAIVSSYAAVLTGAVLGLLLVSNWTRDRRPAEIRGLLVLAFGWAVSATVATWATLRFSTLDTRTYMRDWWAAGFAPWDDGLLAVLLWIPERCFHVLAHYMVFAEEEFGGLAIPAALLAVGGVAVAWTRYRGRALFLAAPLLAALLGGLTETLPMRERASVFAGAPVLLLGMIGLEALLRHRSGPVRWAGYAAVVLAIVPLPAIALTMARPPHRAVEIRPVLAELADVRREGEAVYVYCRATSAAEFYGPRFGLRDWASGDCSGSAPAIFAALDALAPGRVWFVYQYGPERLSLPDSAMAYLARRGDELARISDLRGVSPAEAVLYELEEAGAR
jgi:hypothetical protein